jgi:hypothetical protein
MAKEWVVRGVPQALQRDMWWLTAERDMPQGPKRDHRIASGAGGGGPAVALVALVALADFLFFRHAAGLSLPVFAAAVLGAAMAISPAHARLSPALVLLFASLPVVDYVQLLSVAILGLGLMSSLVMATGGADRFGRRLVGLVADLPVRGLRDGIGLGIRIGQSETLGDHRRQLRNWAFPLGGALVLSALLIEANPVLGEMAFRLSQLDVSVETVERVLFWTGAGLLIWPLIAPVRSLGEGSAPKPLHLPRPNAGSVARGLFLFNAILALQTALDAIYLWGGATLPVGMTAAQYAHRGAYPLLLTALLAGAFALTARAFAREDSRLRLLLLLWLAQNMALTLSALLRLDLYVDAFGLTYLRAYAAIWMDLVAAGLGLTAWQVWRDLPNRWLLLRSLALGAVTLYGASFVNFAAVIAAENLSGPRRLDAAYICALGPMAAAEVAATGIELNCQTGTPQIAGWRDWGFREWRVSRYLQGVPRAEGLHEDPRRG